MLWCFALVAASIEASELTPCHVSHDGSAHFDANCDSDLPLVEVSLLQSELSLRGASHVAAEVIAAGALSNERPGHSSISAVLQAAAGFGMRNATSINATNGTNGTNATALQAPSTTPLTVLDYVLSIVALAVIAVLSLLAIHHYSKGLASETVDMAPLFAEFLGTYVLVFTVGAVNAVGNKTWGATAIGAVLMVMVYATGNMSGGHLNPSVSLAVGLAKKMDWPSVLRYCAVQVIAGVSATFTLCLILPSMSAALMPRSPFYWGHAALIEIFYTFMLCFVVLNCAASRRNNSPIDGNQFYGLAIGFVIIAGGYAGGPISGGSFNPAVSVGLEMVTADSMGWGFAYTIFEVIGALLAAGAFYLIRPEDYTEEDDPNFAPGLLAKCLSEFLGVFTLVMTVGLNVVLGSAATAWSAGAALMCMIYSLGDVSGGHFNPAVTVAVVLSGRGICSAKMGLIYTLVQLIAGILAGMVFSRFHVAGPNREINYPLSYGADFSFWSGSMAEFFYTFVLAYTVLATATTAPPASQKPRQNFYFALCIGSCVTAGGIAVGAISGGELNPAVSIGTVVADIFSSWSGSGGEGSDLGNSTNSSNSNGTLGGNLTKGSKGLSLLASGGVAHADSGSGSDLVLPLYLIFELLGGLFAAVVFQLTHPAEFGRTSGFWSTAAPYLCEYLGTFSLVLTVVCAVATANSAWGALAIGCILMVMIYATGPVSGGNLNPAVSFSLALARKLDLKVMVGYWVAQLLAGISAGICGAFLCFKGLALQPAAPYSWVQAALVEVVYTLMICFVVLNCAASKRNNASDDGNQFFALAIGFVIVAGGYAAGGISGACFNPAVAFGVDLSSLSDGIMWSFAWTAFELFGAVAAAALFRMVRPEEMLSELELVIYEPTLGTKCLSEFLGTFIIVLTVGLNVTLGSKATAISVAAAILCMVYSLGDVSGGHFNPAITLAVVLSGRDKCKPSLGMAYALVQLLAGAIAGHIYGVIHEAGPNEAISYPLEPGSPHTFLSAGLVELVYTFVLCYVVLATATAAAPLSQRSRQNAYFGLCIGSCVTAGGFAIGAVSGGELNPAVATGISFANLAHHGVVGAPSPPANWIPFSMWELGGAFVAAAAFHLTHPFEYQKLGGL